MNVIRTELSKQHKTICGGKELALEYCIMTKILLAELMKWADL